MDTEVLYQEEVTPEVLQSFDEEHAVLRSLKKTAVDNVVGHISLVYELVYPESCRIVKRQGYLDKLMNFESKNSHTRKQFEHIREHMREYLAGNNVGYLTDRNQTENLTDGGEYRYS